MSQSSANQPPAAQAPDAETGSPLSASAAREKRRVALVSVLAAVLLTATKIVVGIATNSLGILSEAAHSGLDLVAAAVTLWAVRASGRPADAEHPYGHGKIENLSAMFETLLLLATCVWIVYEAIERLAEPVAASVDANVWAFGVVALSIVVDISRSRALGRIAKKYHSQALEADALHFSTDVWSSAVVLFGLLGVLVAEPLGLPWLVHADAVAALGVAAIVVGVSMGLMRRALRDLVDGVPPRLRHDIARAAHVAGVVAVRRVRVRRAGPELFADLSLEVEPDLDVEAGHLVAHAAADAVRRLLPGADVVAHVEPHPGAGTAAGPAGAAHRLARRHGLRVHEVREYAEDAGRALELHVEVPAGSSVAAAHGQVTAFEAELRAAEPQFARIVTHLEPLGGACAPTEAAPGLEGRLQEALAHLLGELQVACTPHDLRIRQTPGGVVVSFHCAVDPAMSIESAHALTETLEQALRRRLPELGAVVIHVEPGLGAP